jgi:hypothetical protein
MRFDSGGVWLHQVRVEGLSYTVSPSLPFVEFPLEEGKSWSGEATVMIDIIPVTLTFDTTVADFGALDAGGVNYQDCFRMDTDITARSLLFSLEAETTFWMAPNVGVVSGETTIPPNPITGPVEGHNTFYLLSKNF